MKTKLSKNFSPLGVVLTKPKGCLVKVIVNIFFYINNITVLKLVFLCSDIFYLFILFRTDLICYLKWVRLLC